MANHLKMAISDAILTLHRRKWSIRRIAKELRINRDTVSRHIRLSQDPSKPARAPIGSVEECSEAKPATRVGGAHESNQAMAPIGSEPPSTSKQASLCEPLRTIILGKLEAGLTAQRIYQDLVSAHDFTGKYPSVRRFVRSLEHKQALPFRRMECAPGDEVQVDFGTGIPIFQPDGKRRRTHVFRIVLSHSRKGYSEAVYRQTTEEFIRCLENAFGHFGGVPKALVLDNLKAGVKQPDWYDPDLNPKLRSFADHYGLAVLPTRSFTPRHKGKIESGIGYVKGNALKGHSFTSLTEQNQHLLTWETTVADLRIHGTIRQQVGKLFTDVERPALRPLPVERFPFFHEAERVVHRDGHVEVDKAYYSVPPEYLGHTLWVRWDSRLVRILDQKLEPITAHVKHEPGRFSTLRDHLAAEKTSTIENGAVWLLSQTRRLGPGAAGWAQAMFEARGIEGLRVLQGLLHLGKQHPREALNEACTTALSHISYRLRTIRELLKRRSPGQEVFDFMKEHPLIRPLDDYARFVKQALHKEHS
jgi:transposase